MHGISIPEDVVTYIAENLAASIRELEGRVYRDRAGDSLRQATRLEPRQDSAAGYDPPYGTGRCLRDVERAVCQLFQISADALKSDSRTRARLIPV